MNLNIKKIVNVLIVILLITVIVVSSVKYTELNDANDKLIANISKLNTDIEEKENTISRLTQDNEKLNDNITGLNNNIVQFKNENDELNNNNQLLESRVQELLLEVENLKKEISKQKYTSYHSNMDFKSYMSYKAITNKSSKQWKLQQVATTNEDGVRCVDGIPMVAIGTGWGLWVGDVALVTCKNGNSFKVIVGDIKSDAHTDAERKTTVSNGCRCEFIVDTQYLDPMAKQLGNLSALSKYNGYVVNIEKVSHNN